MKLSQFNGSDCVIHNTYLIREKQTKSQFFYISLLHFYTFDIILFNLFTLAGLSHMILLSCCLKAALRCPTVYIDLSQAALTTFDNVFLLQRLSDIGFCSLCFQYFQSQARTQQLVAPPPPSNAEWGEKRRHLKQLLLVLSLTVLPLVLPHHREGCL